MLASRPGTHPTGVTCTGGTVLTIDGTSTLCRGTTTTTAVPRLAADDTLDTARATASDRAAIRTQLHADLAATPAEPTDTYAGGKWLYRVANLLQLAKAFGADADAATARKLLDDALTRWTEADGCATRADHCFVYDPVLKGRRRHAASYGSDQFNDHHFHYGYFLYAPASVARRPALRRSGAGHGPARRRHRETAPASGKYCPAPRMFDPWAGHSWASGYSPFADGNNQESSSEAVNAWNGLALWARRRSDKPRSPKPRGCSRARPRPRSAYWVEPSTSSRVPGFAHSFVSLNWGGKRDSATWFAADPAAKLGIQLIPMRPVSAYLAGDPGRIGRTWQRHAEAAPACSRTTC